MTDDEFDLYYRGRSDHPIGTIVPRDDIVRYVSRFSEGVSAVQVCIRFLIEGYHKADIQLSLQRTLGQGIRCNKDWSISAE